MSDGSLQRNRHCSKKQEENWVPKAAMSMREVAQGEEVTKEMEGRQPQVITGTRAIFRPTSAQGGLGKGESREVGLPC